MNGELFTLDTNILVYSVDWKAGDRYTLSREIVDRAIDRDWRLTLQAVSEFYAATTRKQILSRLDAATVAEEFLLFDPSIPASARGQDRARALRHGSRELLDSLLVAPAAEADCTAILTEDLADGTDLHGVWVVNPFGGAKLTEAAQQLLGR